MMFGTVGVYEVLWVKDGIAKSCTVRRCSLKTAACCNHCNRELTAGTEVYVLCSEDEVEYMLDESCLREHCTMIGDTWTIQDELWIREMFRK